MLNIMNPNTFIPTGLAVWRVLALKIPVVEASSRKKTENSVGEVMHMHPKRIYIDLMHIPAYAA